MPSDTIELPLSKGYVALIDADCAHLTRHKWHVKLSGNTTYARRNVPKSEGGKRGATQYLHHAVAGTPGIKRVIDHIDGNGLDCRKRNLRETSLSANAHNRSNAQRRGTNTHIGVSYQPGRGLWYAYIRVAGRMISLGRHATEELAHAARLEGERTFWGVEPRRAYLHGDAE